MSEPTTPGTMSWPPRGVGLDPVDKPKFVTVTGPGGEPVEVPVDPRWHNVATVQEGLEKLSQTECLVALDELMSRRPHNKTDLRWQIQLWRQERTAMGNAKDKRADAKEAEE